MPMHVCYYVIECCSLWALVCPSLRKDKHSIACARSLGPSVWVKPMQRFPLELSCVHIRGSWNWERWVCLHAPSLDWMKWLSVCLLDWVEWSLAVSVCVVISTCTVWVESLALKEMQISLGWAFQIDNPLYFTWRVFRLSNGVVAGEKTQTVDELALLPLSCS